MIMLMIMLAIDDGDSDGGWLKWMSYLCEGTNRH